MKHGLWSIVDLDGSETAPAGDAGQDAIDKFAGRKDKALAFNWWYCPWSPLCCTCWGNQMTLLQYGRSSVISFRKNHAWANKLELRRMLYSLKLDEGGSVQAHIKTMMEVFEGLSVVGDPISDEDRVVHLLASLPDSYGMLVTALNKYRNGLSN